MGYRQPDLSAANLNDLPQAKPHFIEPMYARAVQKLPDGKDWQWLERCKNLIASR